MNYKDRILNCSIAFACLCMFENSNSIPGDKMNIDSASQMSLYKAIYTRRTIRDFQEDKVVPIDVLKRIIDAELKAPTHDHQRNWEFIILSNQEDKRKVLSKIINATTFQYTILDKVLKKGTCQHEMYIDVAMPRQYSMLYNASHIILPFFKSNPQLMHPSDISSLNPFASIWCVIQNMLLAATAEGLGCFIRIPFGTEEESNVAKAVETPEDYLFACYIGIGYPKKDRAVAKQNQYTAEQKMHFGKW